MPFASPGSRIGPYEVLERIGQGGVGIVLRARAPGGASEVAVKVLKALPGAASTARFERERKILESLGEVEGFVPILDAGATEEGPFIVMPFLEGGTLRDRLERGPLPWGDVVALAVALASAVGRAHERGIVHRDLKPENVLFSGTGQPLIADLGLAKHFRRDLASPDVDLRTLSTDGTFLGTPAYAAPEQMRDAKAVGPQSDVYSLGAILYECGTGRAPVGGATLIELIDNVRNGKIQPVELVQPDVPSWLARVIHRALARNPWDRYADARDLARALQARQDTSVEPSEAGTRVISADLLREPAREGKTNLLPHATAFVGRKADLEALRALFERGDRLVTLTGPGGTGKTRLATRLGALESSVLASAGGVWFCDLSEVRNVDGILACIGAALGLALTGGAQADAVSQIGSAIAGRGRVLVILDNFEQVVADAPETVARWLAAAPEARFLVTSRERLRIAGEVTYELLPLSLPREGESIGGSEAVQLFLDRARAVRHDHAPSAEEQRVIAEIVTRLDGMPLAIELAAARTKVLGAAKLLERLPRRFELLGGARPDASSRHATLRATIDWSWTALEPWEKDALAQCSVFRGGFSLEAAEAVIDLAAFPEAPWVLDVLQALCEKSLVRAYEPPAFPGERRFGLYESIREYAAEKLASPAAFERHAEHYVGSGDRWNAANGSVALLNRLALESDNLLAVHERAMARAPSTVEGAARAFGAIKALVPLLLETRGPVGALLDLANAALEHPKAGSVDPRLRGAVLSSRGEALCRRGSIEAGHKDLEAALEIALASGDRGVEAEARCRLAVLDMNAGRAGVEAELERELARARERGERTIEAMLLNALTNAAVRRGLIDEALARLESELAIRRELGDRQNQGIALSNLGASYTQKGDLERARQCLEEALEIAREMHDAPTVCSVQATLAIVYMEESRHAQARACIEEAGVIARRTGNTHRERRLFLDMAYVSMDEGRFEEARADIERGLAVVSSPWQMKALDAGLAAVDTLEGRHAEARARYVGVVAFTREAGDRSAESYILGCLGAAEAALGDVREARSALEAVDEVLRTLSTPHAHALEIASLQRGALEVALSREAAALGRAEEARALLEAARARAAAVRVPVGRAPAERSRRVRQALRVLEGMLAAAAAV